MVRLRLRPVNTRVFTWAHGDNECGIAGVDDEMPGYMCEGMSLRIERTEDGWALKQFGFSLFLANPLLICLVARFALDCARRRLTAP